MKRLVFGLFFLLFASNIYSQKATAILSKNSILIGDQVTLTLEFSGAANMTVDFPSFNDTIIDKVEIIRKSNIQTELKNDGKLKVQKQELIISVFDSGYYNIPAIKFVYKTDNAPESYVSETSPLFLVVMPVKVDLKKGIKDIKPPLTVPLTFKEILPYLIILLVVALIVLGIIYYLKKRKKNEPLIVFTPKPIIPPHVKALEALERLREKKLWQNNRIKEFHTELTDIVRTYIEERFNIPALEMVSDDIIASINKLEIQETSKSKLKEMFSLADLVKFAKQNPEVTEHENSFNKAIDFVKTTIESFGEKMTNEK